MSTKAKIAIAVLAIVILTVLSLIPFRGNVLYALKIVIFGGSDDNSPIIIADGSIHVGQNTTGRDDFTQKYAFQAVIANPKYYPAKLGFSCDPTSGACSNTPCNSTNVSGAACTVDLTQTNSWHLALCQSGDCTGSADVDMWGGSGNNSITLTNRTGNFTYPNTHPDCAGRELYYATNGVLTSATLTLANGHSYQFTCNSSGSTTCMTLDYYCHGCK